MTAEPTKRVDRAALRTEARSLEFLLRNYLDDQKFLNSSGTILYFIDAHEMKPYLKPDDSGYLQGFIFEAERTCYASTMLQFEFEMKLRSDQILHSLLFNPGHDVGILPSHCDEVDEELAFHAGAEFSKQIKLLERARDEVRRLRNQGEPRKLIARLNNPDDKTAQRDLVAFIAKEAPSLMVVLRGSPDSTSARLDALGARSNLVRIQDFDWKKLGFDDATCLRLTSKEPSSERMENWRKFLADRPERKRNSFRANRIDGEAIAYLQHLNRIFSESKNPRVVARLVTRTMTLINSVIDLKPNPQIGEADFIRHPRLLARPTPRDRAGDAEKELMVALRTYRRQLETLRSAPGDAEEPQAAPVKALVEAWHDFERARVTIELHAQAEHLEQKVEDSAGDLERLLHWFGAADVADLVNDELRKAVSRFVRATVALEKDVTAPIGARVKVQSHSKRIRLIPTTAGALGPVEFEADTMPGLQSANDIVNVFEKMDTAAIERYIGWAFLFACQEREKHVEDRYTDRKWELADIYARGAIAIGELHHGGPRSRASAHTDEAYLLLAQIQRLGAPAASLASTDATPALQRYKSAMKLLGKFKRKNDPRWAREHAAQILEFRLEVGQQSGPDGSDIASGIEWIHRALEWAAGDTVLLPRILELGLTYHLAASRFRDIWTGRTSVDVAVARSWHERLQAVLQQQRSEVPREEISRRALAMEIIGFRLLRAPGGGYGEASESILAFARDLRAEIGPSTDKCAELIKVALESVSRSERDLVSAPIWGSHPTDWIIGLADDRKAAQLMTSGYANLTRIAGGSQKAAVIPLDSEVLEEIAREFDEASQILDTKISLGEERAREARFYARMEVCYAKLLLALIDEENGKAKLEQLIADYEAISRDYPQASIPHFRLDSIYTELDRNEKAFAELTKSVNLVRDDPFLHVPDHWVRSTIQRRIGARFSEEAALQRSKLTDQPDLLDSYLDNLLRAFRSVYADAMTLPKQQSDVLYELEARRRINNILYYASLVLEVCPGPEGFLKLGIDKAEMHRLLAELKRGDIKDLSEIGILHTIGAAYAALDEMDAAVEVGNHLVNVAKQTTDAARVAPILADAFTWIQRRGSLARHAVDPIFEKPPETLGAASN